MQKADLVGRRFGKLEVKEETKKGKNVAWVCKCDCGNTTIALTNSLLSGRKVSCGCYKKEFAAKPESSKNRLFASYRKTAHTKGLEFKLTEEMFFSLVKDSCFYCGIEPQNVMKSRTNEFVYNGIDRIDSSKGYIEGNVVPCCSTCNYAKRNMGVEQFLNWVSRIYKNQYVKPTEITPGQLIDLLFTTDYKCWWAQERLLDRNLSVDERADEARKAQEYNAKRTNLIRTIDITLGYADSTNTEKTYTYFKDKKE